MNNKPDIQPLLDHLHRNNGIDPEQAGNLVAEVIAYFNESPEHYVRRRHLELKQGHGMSNPDIFDRIGVELQQLVFAAPKFSPRQIRRIIYG